MIQTRKRYNHMPVVYTLRYADTGSIKYLLNILIRGLCRIKYITWAETPSTTTVTICYAHALTTTSKQHPDISIEFIHIRVISMVILPMVMPPTPPTCAGDAGQLQPVPLLQWSQQARDGTTIVDDHRPVRRNCMYADRQSKTAHKPTHRHINSTMHNNPVLISKEEKQK